MITLRRRIGEQVRNLYLPGTLFNLRVGWADDYLSLFQSEFEAETSIDALLGPRVLGGRVLLGGRGGAGKSILVHRLAVEEFEKGNLPILIRLRRWHERLTTGWIGVRGDWSALLQTLLQDLAEPATSFHELDSEEGHRRRTLLIDGLNEMPVEFVGQVLEAANLFAATMPNSLVICTDRVMRRGLPAEGRWKLAMLLPLSEEEIGRVLREVAKEVGSMASGHAFRSLLDSPFLLDKVMIHPSASEGATSQAALILQLLTDHASLSREDLEQLASAAFEMYRAFPSSRSFEVGAFEARAPRVAVASLLEAGFLKIRDSDCRFLHHLYHDALAASHLSANPGLWNYEGFDTLSFRASSMDGLVLASELLSPEEGDAFIRALYDWNLYAPAYVINETSGAGRYQSYSSDMAVAMLAVLAERRFDLLQTTAQRAADALAVCSIQPARGLREAANVEAVLRVACGWESKAPWFNAWKGIFCRPLDGQAQDEELVALSDPDSLLGWAAANTLRRRRLTGAQGERLLEVARSGANDSVRWRAVHVLGRHATPEAVRVLLEIFEDYLHPKAAFSWVAYGLARSVVEAAATGGNDVRLVVVKRLLELVPLLAGAPIYLEELRKSLLIDPGRAPENWLEYVGSLVWAFYENSQSTEEREMWSQFSGAVSRLYSRKGEEPRSEH